MQPIVNRLPLVVQITETIELAGGVVALEFESCLAKQRKLGRGGV